MSGFWANFRDGRNQVRAAHGASPLPERRELEHHEVEPTPSYEEAVDLSAPSEPNVSELQEALQARENELDEAKRLIGELKDYAEQLQDRVVELIAGSEPMAKALLLPGVKTFLLQRFHPDKHPGADERQYALLTEAMKTITAAYARAAELQTSE